MARERARWSVWNGDPQRWLGWTTEGLPSVSELIGGAFRLPLRGLGIERAWVEDHFPPRDPLPVAPLLTLPPPETPFPCRIQVRESGFAGLVLGTDMGVVTFLEGWLHYEGYRTRFALRPGDVEEARGGRLDLGEEGGILELVPNDTLLAQGLYAQGLRRRFDLALGDWLCGPSPEGDPVLPPATMHRSGLAAIERTSFGTFLAVIASGMMASPFGPFWPLITVPIALVHLFIHVQVGLARRMLH